MASRFQHRLVGTIILVAIGIIFLPDLLDGQKVKYQEQTASIPLRPVIESPTQPVSFEEFDDAVLVDQSKTVTLSTPEPQTKRPEVKTTRESTPKPKLVPLAKPIDTKQVTKAKSVKSDVIGQSWKIRLGAFKNSDAVDELVVKIQKAGYDAYRLPRRPVKGQLNRLYVGPNVDKAKLEKLLPKLQKITGLKGVIQKFDPRDK